MNWQENDLKVVDLREKIIELTDKFDKRNGKGIENYYQKLNRFLDNRLKRQSNPIFAEQIFMTISSLKVPNRNI